MLKPYIQNAPQPTHSRTQDPDMLTSNVVMSYADYHFPLGWTLLRYGWRSRELDRHAADEETLFAGQWSFNPASWMSYHSIQIQARLLVQFGAFSKPRITPSLTFRACVSAYHPVWECIKKGDLVAVRRHLSIGSIGINDTTLTGMTLLSAVGRRL